MLQRTGPVDCFTINVIHEPAVVPMTPRKREICLTFGLPPRESPRALVENVELQVGPGRIVLLCGASGSGKSSILRRLAEQVESPIWVGRSALKSTLPLIDAIAPRQRLSVAMEILTACGMGEPRLWIRRYTDLSDGEKFRAALARAIGTALRAPSPGTILCDEFTALLHRRAAKAIAHNLRKLVSRHHLSLVVATAQDDIIEDLQPDEIVRLGGHESSVVAASPSDRPISLRRDAFIEPGSLRDYRRFGEMHYRTRDGLGFVDKVFLLRESSENEPLGILIFAHAPRELALRNLVTQGRFIRNMRRLNRELRILRRLVMHPDIRGCGLGHWFVRSTLPMVGVRFVECLAVMGAVNPIFEKAGMTRIGRCPLPRGRLALLNRMRQMKLDPFTPDFDRKVALYPRIRELVERTIRDWVTSTQSAAPYDVAHRTPLELAAVFRQIIGEPPMYYLWDRDGEFPLRDTVNRSNDDPPTRSPSRRSPHRTPRIDTPKEKDRHRPDGNVCRGKMRRSRYRKQC